MILVHFSKIIDLSFIQLSDIELEAIPVSCLLHFSTHARAHTWFPLGLLNSCRDGVWVPAHGKVLMKAIFSSWLGLMVKVRAEKDIRQKFEDQIALCEKRLFQYKEAQIAMASKAEPCKAKHSNAK